MIFHDTSTENILFERDSIQVEAEDYINNIIVIRNNSNRTISSINMIVHCHAFGEEETRKVNVTQPIGHGESIREHVNFDFPCDYYDVNIVKITYDGTRR